MSKKVTTEEIKERIISIHNDKYILDKVNYTHNKTNITLICREHGEFDIIVGNLIGNKRGCPKCGIEKSKKSCLSNINDFIKKSNIKHNNKYSYEKSIYINWKTPLIILCNEHGEFIKTPNEHLNGTGCLKCKKIEKEKNLIDKKKLVSDQHISKIQNKKENFIKISENLHMKKYDYSLVEYTAVNKKVKIICKEHGIFEKTPHHHKNGQGCPECSYINKIGNIRKDTKSFILICQKKHSNYYKYDKTIYSGHNKKVIITCPKHGYFEQLPYYHSIGGGCKHCSTGGNGKGGRGNKNSGRHFKYTNDEFIKICNEVHSNKYDYDKCNFEGVKKNIIVICDKHGEFNINSYNHKNGQGCQICSMNDKSMNIEEFLVKTKDIHKERYSYYIDNNIVKSLDKIKIKCEEHGYFTQIASVHLSGSGCNLCITKSRGEISIINFLEEYKIKYIREKTFNTSKRFRFDFYLEDENTCIEYDGKHHFQPIKYFGGIETFEKIKENDKIKNEYCVENKINLIRISYKELKNIHNILKNKLLYDKFETK
jgi:very-short-patch-repair endonuclease